MIDNNANHQLIQIPISSLSLLGDLTIVDGSQGMVLLPMEVEVGGTAGEIDLSQKCCNMQV